MKLNTKTALVTSLLAMKQGIDTQLTATTVMNLGGVVVTAPQVSAQIDVFLDAIQDTANAKQAYQVKLALEQTSNAAARLLMTQMDAVLTSMYGPNAPAKGKFGALRPAPLKLTADELAVAVEKRKATRAARMTMGKRQRAKVVAKVAPAAVGATR